MTGVDRVYAVDVPVGQRLKLTATPVSSGVGPFFELIAGPASACDNAATRVCHGGSAFYNNSGGTQRVFVRAAGSRTDLSLSDYQLTLTADVPGPGDVCETATPLVVGAPLSNQTLVGRYGDYFRSTGCTDLNANPDAVYRVTIAPRKRLTVSVVANNESLSVSLVDAASGCANPQCLTPTRAAAGSPASLQLTNPGSAPKDIFVFVEENGPVVTGSFDITATLDDPPPGDVCETALPDDGGVRIGTLVGATDDYSGIADACPPGALTAGPEVALSYDVPAGRRLTLVTTPTNSFDPTVWLTSGVCDNGRRSCLNGAFESTGPFVETLRWYNAGTSSTRVSAVVEGGTGFGDFSVAGTIDTPLPQDVVQLAGTPITANTSLSGLTTVGYANDYSGPLSCSGAGADRVHEVIVPAGQTIQVRAFPSALYNVTLSLVMGPPSQAVPPLTCLAFSTNAGAGQADTLFWSNDTGQTRNVLVVVDSNSAAASTAGAGTYALTVDFMSSGGSGRLGDTVWTAEPWCPGVTPGLSTGGFFNDYSPTLLTCPEFGALQGVDGADRVFAVDLAPWQSLEAMLPTSAGAASYALYVLDSTPLASGITPRCLAGSVSAGRPVVQYWNRSAAPHRVYVVVDASMSGIVFSLSLEILR